MSTKYTVVLDPGHGPLTNPYPAASGYYEGTQMYKLMYILRSKLMSHGINVKTTRNTVTDDPALDVRGKLAGSSKADLFISLHSDAVGNGIYSATGVTVFYSKTDPTKNKKFATALASEVSKVMGTRNRGAQIRTNSAGNDYYAVVRNAAASGCKCAFLIEHGFHTSVSDVKWLISDNNLQKIAEAETKVICDHFGIKYKEGTVADIEDAKTNKITIVKALYKYTNAANALSGDTSLAVGTMAAGTYYVYRTYNGATNLTKTAGVPGSWVVVGDADKTQSTIKPIETPPVSQTIDVTRNLKIYNSSADAMNMTNPVKNQDGYVYYRPNKYYLYKKVSDKVLNITLHDGIPGAWVNLDELDVPQKPDFDIGDIVIFKTGVIRYVDKSIVPTSVIAQVCGQKNGVVLDIDDDYNVLVYGIEKQISSIHLQKYADANDTTKKIVSDYNKFDDISKPAKTSIYDILIGKFGSDMVNDELYAEFIDYLLTIMDDDTPLDDEVGYESIVGKSVLTADQLYKFIKRNNPDFDYTIAYSFIKIGEIYGLRGDVACCQSILETGWFKFIGSSVKPQQNNFCGLGATGNGATGCSFDSVEKGVEAQLQHLYAYACKSPIPTGRTLYDPRFNYVTRGCAPRWVDLNNKWCTGSDYGEKILSIYKQACTNN